MTPTAQTTPVLDIFQETPDTQTFRLGVSLSFKAGQSISLLIPGDPKPRYYSISSSPTEKDHIDITIKADRGNPLYASLFTLKKGAPVEIAGPFGSFTLPDDLSGPYYFLAAGSGVTPFRAMTKFILDSHPTTETWLIHSVKTPDDLIFKEQFLSWTQIPSFHYIPTFTRWDKPDHKGETGRICATLLNKHLPILKGTSFLCGPKDFVKDMEHVLGELHVSADHIRREQW